MEWWMNVCMCLAHSMCMANKPIHVNTTEQIGLGFTQTW